ncbi:DNA-3-methyladenine glycosylase [Candidatus Woesearchaeota archaeon]|nr:DNA-3-methyladenine glycosylase [Candidatus Woesearchaeota archaeon]
MRKELPADFFRRDTVVVARELVGKLLVVDGRESRITETEAYKDDGASHARTRTRRSAPMFDTYGHLYVYLIYGMYHCLNITTDEGPGAVLIRATDGDGCNGPGRLCRCLGITTQESGLPLGGRVKVLDDGHKPAIARATRIGIKEDALLEWRFYDADSDAVSRR